MFEETQWKKLKNEHKIDYFLAYYAREYNLNLYGQIADILTEYIKKPEVQKKTKAGKKLSKREQYLKRSKEECEFDRFV